MAGSSDVRTQIGDLISRMDAEQGVGDDAFVAYSDEVDAAREAAKVAGVDQTLIDELNDSFQKLAGQLSFCTLG